MVENTDENRVNAGIRDACTALSIAFANAVDSRDYARVLSVFTEDGIFERWDQTFTGRREIATMLDARPQDVQPRHICSNIEIRPEASDEATGVTYFLFFREPGDGNSPMPLTGPKMMGEYHDRFCLTGSGWRIAHRSIKIVFQDESSGK